MREATTERPPGRCRNARSGVTITRVLTCSKPAPAKTLFQVLGLLERPRRLDLLHESLFGPGQRPTCAGGRPGGSHPFHRIGRLECEKTEARPHGAIFWCQGRSPISVQPSLGSDRSVSPHVSVPLRL